MQRTIEKKTLKQPETKQKRLRSSLLRFWNGLSSLIQIRAPPEPGLTSVESSDSPFQLLPPRPLVKMKDCPNCKIIRNQLRK